LSTSDRAVHQAIDEEAVHLEERVAAHAEPGVFNRRRDAQSCERGKRLTGDAIDDIYLYVGLVAEELDRGARLGSIDLADGLIQLRRGDGAVIDRAEVARALAEIANLAVLDVQLHSITILPRFA